MYHLHPSSYNAVTKALRKVHDGPIFAICVLKDGSIVTGGGKDRRLVQFDASYRKSGLEAEVMMNYPPAPRPRAFGAVLTKLYFCSL
jgi:hypothetical protein